MTIFTILMPTPQPQIVEAMKEAFPDDHLIINETQCLVSSAGTVMSVTAKLGIYDAKNPSAPSTGSAIVFAISSYYGRAPTMVWDWIKAKLETPANG